MATKTADVAQHFPLPPTDFRCRRRGPWPQPAPDHPMGMAAEVLHPANYDQLRWNWTVRINYFKALLTKLPLAFYNWFINNRIEHLSDPDFVVMLTTTSYSKFLRRRTAQELAGTDFAKRLGTFDPQQAYLIADFTPMQDIQPYPGVYVAPAIALFSGHPSKAPCAALAISIGHLEGGAWKQIVLTPEDGGAWQLAKYFVVQGGAHMVALSGHPATHFPYDTVNAITVTAVPFRHTLFRLLEPHLDLHLAVDNAVLEGGHSVVSETHGEFYAPFAGNGTAVRQLVASGFFGYPNPYSKYEPSDTPGPNYPGWTYPVGPSDIPSNYGRFLKAYHEPIQDFVREVVRHIHAQAATRAGQEELYYIKRWARYAAQWLPGFPDENQILQPGGAGEPYPVLVAALSTYIWDVAVAHGLEHCVFGRLGPQRTCFRVRVPPPESTQAPQYARSKILKGWDMFKATLAFEMFFKPHNITLLLDAKYSFEDEGLKAAVVRFKRALVATEEKLIQEGIDVTQYARVTDLASSIQY